MIMCLGNNPVKTSQDITEEVEKTAPREEGYNLQRIQWDSTLQVSTRIAGRGYASDRQALHQKTAKSTLAETTQGPSGVVQIRICPSINVSSKE